jgi:hypothetical protein
MVGFAEKQRGRGAVKRRDFITFRCKHRYTMIFHQSSALEVSISDVGVEEQQIHRLNPASQPNTKGGF